MEAVHFTTIPYEPYRAHQVQGYFYAGFEEFRTFYELCYSFRALTVMGKCTSHHLFSPRRMATLKLIRGEGRDIYGTTKRL